MSKVIKGIILPMLFIFVLFLILTNFKVFNNKSGLAISTENLKSDNLGKTSEQVIELLKVKIHYYVEDYARRLSYTI